MDLNFVEEAALRGLHLGDAGVLQRKPEESRPRRGSREVGAFFKLIQPYIARLSSGVAWVDDTVSASHSAFPRWTEFWWKSLPVWPLAPRMIS